MNQEVIHQVRYIKNKLHNIDKRQVKFLKQLNKEKLEEYTKIILKN